MILLSGCTVPQDSDEEEEYDEYDPMEKWWNMFNPPTWDSTYLLENVLDQFTLGFNSLDVPLFNVTSSQSNPQEPVVYWRLGSLESYEYTDKTPYTTDWNPAEPTYKRVIPTEGYIYSQKVPTNFRTAQFAIRVPMNYSDPLIDVTINPYFINNIPTTWNGVYGSYIDSNSFQLYDSNSNPVTATTTEAREEFTYVLEADLSGIDANIIVDRGETSKDLGFLEYTIDYLSPSIQKAAAFSMTRDESNYLKCLDNNTWANIKTLYLQLPNTTGTLPHPCNVGGTPSLTVANPTNDYEIWAPNVVGNATDWNQPEQTVFGQAYYNMQQLENFTFDEEQWFAAETGIPVEHPAEYEDYNEWFMRRGKGISLHFASAYATIMRLQRIPSRVVIGYLAGNDSAQYYPWRVVTRRYLHAWTEVLVPIDTALEQRAEWISFDPLLSYLAWQYDMELPADVVPAFSSENQTTMIRPDYDLENNGLLAAFYDHISAQNLDEQVFERCIVNNSQFSNGTKLTHGENINISVRLISAPSLESWLPYQGANVSFYVGDDNTTGSSPIEKNGILIGSAITDSLGVATIYVTIDIVKFGIRDVHFYSVVWLTPSVRKAAMSHQYKLVLFRSSG